MSVINKMLRDLDSRRAADMPPIQNKKSRTAMESDTVVVNDFDRAWPRRSSLNIGVVVTFLVLAGGGGAWWYLNPTGFPQSKVEMEVVTLLVDPVINPSVIGAAPQYNAYSGNAQPKAEPENPSVAAKLSAGPPILTRSSRSEATGTPSAVSDLSVTEWPVTLAPVTPVETMATPQVSQRDSPGMEVLAQAQSLWDSGYRQAAMNLLREALVKAERPISLAPVTPVASVAAPQISRYRLPVLESLAQAQSLWDSGARQAAMDLLREALSASGLTDTAKAALDRPVTERPVTLAPATPVATVTAPEISQRRSPGLEALAQAQSLWRSGSRQAAMDLLRDALAVVERTNPVGTPSGDYSELVLLARELARMDLIEGRAGPTLEMLTRLEPALSGFADVWAIRGNAAQRLGRHQESAAAYLMALKLRPNEPRWMLGAAVSLAAQGQTMRAAELAEKARIGGVLSPEVATYLRQLGVPLGER